MSEQTVSILIRLLLRSSLIRIYAVCQSFYIFWRHYFLVKLNCFILRTTTVAGLDVPIFRVFTVYLFYKVDSHHTLYSWSLSHREPPDTTYIENLTRVVISYEIYETSIWRVS